MLRKTLWLLLFCLSVCLTAAAQERAVLQEESAQAAWREDLQVMWEGMQRIHPNLFWRMTAGEFEQAVTLLDADIPYLTDEQIKVRFIQIAAMIDGHSQIGIFQKAVDFHLYGVRFYAFTDGIFVVDAQPEYQEAVGKRLVSIGSSPIEEAYPQIASVSIYDNEYMLKLTTAFTLAIPEMLRGLGITDSLDQPAYVVEDSSGKQLTINPTPLTLDEYLAWGGGYFITLPPNPDVLYLQHQYDEAFWFTYLEDSRTLYIQYNEVQRTNASGKTLTRFADEVKAFTETTTIDRTIVDLRHNTGGDNRTYPPLLRLLQENPTFNTPGKLYVIIGRMTLSAATNFATELEQSLQPIFVGEATGEPPNLYADARAIILPNSQIQMMVSSHYIQKSSADDTRLMIEPSLPALLSASDYFSGHDPALEAILNAG